MIDFRDNLKDKPYILLRNFYKKALDFNQKNIEAIAISSYNKNDNEVNSRFVNLKYIEKDKWVFFTNYNSRKSQDFNFTLKLAQYFIGMRLIYKSELRLISKNYPQTSLMHILLIEIQKNALAIASNQSSKAESHGYIKNKYLKVLNSKNEYKRPDYWGGYTFTPIILNFGKGILQD